MIKVLAAALLVLGSGCGFLRGYASGSSADMPRGPQPSIGFHRLMFDDFHGLDTDTLRHNAVSWKVLTAALMLEARRTEPGLPLTEAAAMARMSGRYGFLLPIRVANWPLGTPQPKFRRPLGLVSGTIRRSLPAVELEAVNTGCATCHAATTYDAEGRPTLEAWVGLPSTSINLGRYADELFAAFRWASERPQELLAAVRAMFPSVSETELSTLRRFYLPELRTRVAELDRTIGAFTPYSNGSPGLTNGVATVKMRLGALPVGRRAPGEVAFVAMPDFGALRWKTSLLIDGVYAPPGWAHEGPRPHPLSGHERHAIAGVATMVTFSTLGVSPETAAKKNTTRMRDVIDYLVTSYEPPPFPGRIDHRLAEVGAGVYADRCARCHGTYRREGVRYRLIALPNRSSAADVIGTDPVRAEAVGAEINDQFARTALGRQMHARRMGGYLATPLTGVWATAPYLHNGSVPTLWHLMHPEERPARFQVGGHRLDFTRMGIAGELDAEGVYRYPAAYRPWSDPEILDTRLPGRSARGHDAPFDEMPEDDKRALLEFMKCL